MRLIVDMKHVGHGSHEAKDLRDAWAIVGRYYNMRVLSFYDGFNFRRNRRDSIRKFNIAAGRVGAWYKGDEAVAELLVSDADSEYCSC